MHRVANGGTENQPDDYQCFAFHWPPLFTDLPASELRLKDRAALSCFLDVIIFHNPVRAFEGDNYPFLKTRHAATGHRPRPLARP
jgi:hypothetical protein